MEKIRERHSVKTEKRNRIIIEEINPKEISEVWNKLKELNEAI